MRVLFVGSGNKMVGKVNSFVQSQYDSLAAAGMEMALFPVVGHGVSGYLHNLKALRRQIGEFRPDVVHAHYSTCGFLVTLAMVGFRIQYGFRPKTFVSILGSFPTRNLRYRVIRWFIQHVWQGALVKSERTRRQLDLPLPVVPNGVNLSIFYPQNQTECRQKVGFESDKKYIVWCSNPNRPEKNWPLAEEAVRLLNSQYSSSATNTNVELVAVFDQTPEMVATYMNAADCMLLTSDSEGSPNVIKEALSCNCPLVTTNVGDVEERLIVNGKKDELLEGCYIVEDNDLRFTDMAAVAPMVAQALAEALKHGRTNGYQRILDDKLAVDSIAQRLIKIYEGIL